MGIGGIGLNGLQEASYPQVWKLGNTERVYEVQSVCKNCQALLERTLGDLAAMESLQHVQQ